MDQLTPFPAADATIHDLLAGVQAIFGARLTGFYLEGSLALGELDAASDLDFLAVTDSEIGAAEFTAIQRLHTDLAGRHPYWGTNLEGSYLPGSALRRFDPAHPGYPNIERGAEERLKLVRHDATWTVHWAILRQHGIALLGPPPAALLDPVTPQALRAAMQPTLAWYAAHVPAHPAALHARGYQSYIVLTMARIAYTLDHGAVGSKRQAAVWAMQTFGPPWDALIARALEGRLHWAEAVPPADESLTVELVAMLARQYGSG